MIKYNFCLELPPQMISQIYGLIILFYMKRIQNINSQLKKNDISLKSDNDVVICSAVRTPLTKANKGLLKNTPPQIMLQHVFKGVVQKIKLDPKYVQDIAVGNVLQPGGGAMVARIGQFLAGFPETTTIMAVTRQCSSGLEACGIIFSKIKAGTIDIGIGSGVQSMSLYDIRTSRYKPEKLWKTIFDHPTAKKCLIPMGITSENVAQKYGISKSSQNQMAYESHQKAYKAQTQGLYKQEIIPVKTTYIDKQGKRKQVFVIQDDGIKKETTIQGLNKLKPAFKQSGSTTAGNSSQITDGAAAVLLVRRSTAIKLGLPILAKFVDYAVAGVPPQIMGIGPAVAIPEVLRRTGLKLQDIDIFQINEAFASQATYCINYLKINPLKLNPKGGAIALGHPLGCTGARQIATLLPQLKRTNGKYGIVSMCIGSGMGAAALIQRQ